ncbi:DUF5937 family protein [Sphaerisporangium fuscum]|uniref:DUF5937 family protein n=1 Tax=Sphaerisporangium fuscum TaxID=2835868 RepID=UPI001BDCF3F0|nr:DUF5937 family protein [Sphaerisporangium fuscum]
MLRLRLSLADVAGLRFAFSPLWEIVAGVRVLNDPAAHALHLPWVRSARARLKECGAEVPLLRALVPAPPHVLPGFLAPTPLTPLPSFDAELAALAGTDPELCRDDLRRVFGGLDGPPAEFDHAPGAALRTLVAQVRTYHDVVLAPDWPKIRALLEGDIMYRGRRLVQGGVAGLFADLDPSIGWHDDRVTISGTVASADHDLGERGLVLVPSAFTWPRVFVKAAPPWVPVVRYPARGMAELWAAPRAAPDGLSRVVGRSRARLLAELDAPASTTELARRTGLAAGGVSAHLSRLRAAGLVTSHRAGAVVLYARTSLGDALLRPGAGQS